MPACTLRPAGDGDAAFLLGLYAETRRDELAVAGWTPVQIDTFLHLQFAARDAHYRAQFPAADAHIVEVQGMNVGRLLVDRRAEALHLVDIALLPAWRGQGLGTALLRGLQREAAASRLPLQLHVEMHNPARGLYRRLGFTETGTQGLHVAMHWQAPGATTAEAPSPERALPSATRVAASAPQPQPVP